MKTRTIMLGLAVWISASAVSAEAPPKTCINNMRMLQAATDQAAIEGNRASGAVIPANVISDYIRGGIASLKCPANGVYTFGTVDEEPFCSMHGTMDGVMKGGGVGLGTKELLGRNPATEAEVALDEILQAMLRDQGSFDPAVLKSKGAGGMRQLADRLFPQTAVSEGDQLSRKEFEQWMRKLAAGNFKEREEAESQLAVRGRLYQQDMALAARSSDPEVKRRANSIRNTWHTRNQTLARVDFAKHLEAFKVYVSAIEGESYLPELQLRAKAAQTSGVINGGQKQLIDVCLAPEEK